MAQISTQLLNGRATKYRVRAPLHPLRAFACRFLLASSDGNTICAFAFRLDTFFCTRPTDLLCSAFREDLETTTPCIVSSENPVSMWLVGSSGLVADLCSQWWQDLLYLLPPSRHRHP